MNNNPKDTSQQKILTVSNVGSESITGATQRGKIEIDAETKNLLDWLAKEQGIDKQTALKKAVVVASYMHDLTVNQRGKLLVERQDKSIGEINLK